MGRMSHMRGRCLYTVGALSCLALLASGRGAEGEWKKGFETISEADLEAHLLQIATPHLEGRDSPSEGLSRAAKYIIERFKLAGIEPAGDGGFRHPFTVKSSCVAEERCRLTMTAGEDIQRFELGQDFVPFPFCDGRAEGEVVFLGFGISGARRYDDLGRRSYKGKVALILSGEPRHKSRFEGPVVTKFSDTYAKARELQDRGCVGALVVRRNPAEIKSKDGTVLPPTKLGYRHTWGRWNPATTKGMAAPEKRLKIPVAEITEAVATRILGQDMAALAAKLDKTAKPKRIETEVTIALGTGTRSCEAQMDNIFGIVRGTDEGLAGEYVVVGAHYDHVGVDWWGRVGCGADDNGSGTVAALELAEAFALSPPRRSLIFAFFAAEEDGLIGSDAFADELPFLGEPSTTRSGRPVVAMLNMDMLGRGKDKEVAVLGTRQNPSFEKTLKRAKKFSKTGLKKIITGKGMHLWERSDHYSFHKRDIPVLFFMESPSETDNPDYHTFRDTIDSLSLRKIANTTRLVFNTAWLLATDEGRPPAPR
ncbi:MAG: hypothetical protein CMJ89_07755 [Planctomycetes bacterium]|nr:hypothetical protein [Planctomycetota bacterium]